VDLLILQQLCVSLGLGLLLGLERERQEPSIGGIRTFPLISLFGTVCALVGQSFGGWMVGVGLLVLAMMLVFANYVRLKNGQIDPGITTEVAALLLYALGVLIVAGTMSTAIVLGGIMALVLHFKKAMHGFAAAVGDQDMRAIMQFVFLTLIILPVLPNQNYGPFEVWNPFKIWLMVVLIVGISLGGYVAYKIFGARAGAVLGGLFGGLISSTATTVSYARRCATEASLAPLGALVIMIASGLSLARVLVEIAVVTPGSFSAIAPPIVVLLGVCGLLCAGLYIFSPKTESKMPVQNNPAELKAAFVFGGLYALVLLSVAIAKEHFGSTGLYVVSVISGLTDMDAITLSTAGLVESGDLSTTTAWRAIVIAAMANFIFKFGVVAAVGGRALAGRVGLVFALVLLSGGALIWLWPA